MVEVKAPPDKPPQQEIAKSDAAPPSRNAKSLDECVDLILDAKSLPASGNDRTLYDKALAEQRAGDWAEARKSYFELIKDSPASSFIPLAYLAFAELFRKQAEQKPAMTSLAVSAYQKVTTFQDSTAHAYALFRIAEAKQHDDPTEALDGYLKAASNAPDSPCPDVLGQAAREGLTNTYVDVGRPDRAWPFFRRVAPDDDTAARMLADLIHKYEAAGKPQDGCRAVHAASDAARASETLKAVVSRCASRP